MSVLPLSRVMAESDAIRIDSGFFSPAALSVLDEVRSLPHLLIRDIVGRIQHPAEVVRVYAETGLPIVLAQNVRPNSVDVYSLEHMPLEYEPLLSRSQLSPGDLCMTRTGANFGQVGPWPLDALPAYACADVLVFRTPGTQSGFLSAFLNSKKGRLLIERGAYGASQPHVAPEYLKFIPCPSFAELSSQISKAVTTAQRATQSAVQAVGAAADHLARALALPSQAIPRLNYTRSSRDALASGRLDAQFHSPDMIDLHAHLSASGLTIRDVAPPRRSKFQPAAQEMIDYVEISDVSADGTARATTMPARDAPSRATWTAREGDVLTSLVRPNRGLTAIVTADQDGAVASSGFTVLHPEATTAQVLLVYLKLPAVRALLDLHTSASMYPAISDGDLLAIPFPAIDAQMQAAVTREVQVAFAARRRARTLLDGAVRAVEIAMEGGEAAALAHLEAVQAQVAEVV